MIYTTFYKKRAAMTCWDYVYVQFKQLEFTLPALVLLIGVVVVSLFVDSWKIVHDLSKLSHFH